MNEFVRLMLSSNLIDLSQAPVVTITEKNGKFQMNLSLGITAKHVDPSTPPTNGEANSRDIPLNVNIYTSGKANIAHGIRLAGSSTSGLIFSFDGDVESKIPGTGAGGRLNALHFAQDNLFASANVFNENEVES